MIPPRWFTIRRGPLLRGGSIMGGIPFSSIPGKIWLMDNFRREPHTADCPNLLHPAIVVPEQVVACRKSIPVLSARQDCVVEFAGDGDHFRPLADSSSYLLQELRRITQPRLLARVYSLPCPAIAINVRLGRDFSRATQSREFLERGALRTPIGWYVEVLREIRCHLGETTPARIISDGNSEDLRPLLEEPNVEHLITRHAIEDLLVLASASHIIGSGGSSFTAWGAFLAQADVVTVEGQSLEWFQLDQASRGRVSTRPL